MSYAVYAALYLAMLLNFAGYIYLLAYIRRVRPWAIPDGSPGPGAEAFPSAVVIIPTHNEAGRIERKLTNALALAYPHDRLRIVVVDGVSTDGTAEVVRRVAKWHPERRVDLVEVAEANKMTQLNAALKGVERGSIVVITDADTTIDVDDALERAARLLSDPAVALVGGWSMPPARGPMFGAETAYWDKQNRFRYMETACFSSSIVVAPFYAFRAGFIESFPSDCVADDVFASFYAHDSGLRVVYTPTIRVTEERQPGTLGELVRHKFRKMHAYTTELLRVAHRLPHMSKRHRVLVTFKLLQMFVLPWAVLFFGISTIHLLAHGAFEFVAATLGVLVLAVVVASILIVPPPGMHRGGLRPVSLISSAFVFALLTVLLVVNFFVFPFYRQRANYRPVGG